MLRAYGVARVRRLVCRLWGHDWISASAPVRIPFFPHVERLVLRVCDRCGIREWDINDI